ncbi:MAG: hypothetical protein IH989_05215 [Planctomycetes bacterium]|nr:hypothetical protein [Planctomycetota bacterium]
MKKTVITALALAVALTGGCAQHKVVEVWQPKPMVYWQDLSNGPILPVRDEFRIMPGKPRGGIFPGSLAVTRVSIEMTGDPERPLAPRLTSDPHNEFLQWNSALDDQFAVGEVFPISGKDLGGGPAEPDQILAAFNALHARLGLVYAVNELSKTQTEMLGVLYDAENKSVLAVLHAYSASIVPPEVIDESKKPIDMWETDSRALVRAKFERILHGCIYELIQRDGPATIVTPVGWKPTAPTRPVVWPPRKTGAFP